MKCRGKTIDVVDSFVEGAEHVEVSVGGEAIALTLDKARFLVSQLEATIDAQEKRRRMRELKAGFDISGTMESAS